MLKFTLKRYESGSVIVAADDLKQIGELHYTRKIHQHESEADYSRIVTQLKTYGDDEAMEEFNRIKQKQEGDKS